MLRITLCMISLAMPDFPHTFTPQRLPEGVNEVALEEMNVPVVCDFHWRIW